MSVRTYNYCNANLAFRVRVKCLCVNLLFMGTFVYVTFRHNNQGGFVSTWCSHSCNGPCSETYI